MMNARTSLWASMAIAASVGLAGCGGSSDDPAPTPEPPAPTVHEVDLPDEHGLSVNDEPLTLASGDTTKGRTTLTCTPEEGSTGCMLTVKKRPILDTYEATSTGGTVTVVVAPLPEPPAPPPPPPPPAPMVDLPLPEGNTIRKSLTEANTGNADTDISESITVDAGMTKVYSGVRFTCPEGPNDCKVNFTLDADTAKATTGGEDNGAIAPESVVLVSTVGTGVKLSTLNSQLRSGIPSTDIAKINNRLGLPKDDDSNPYVSRQLKSPDDDGKSSTPSKLVETPHGAAEVPSDWTGWAGTAWAGGSQTLVRFTNQSAGMTFKAKYGAKVGNPDNVTSAATDAANFWDLVRIPSVAGRSGRVPVSPSTGSGAGAGFTLSATFDGVAGTLRCAACSTVLSNEGGKLRNAAGDGDPAGDWTFTADDNTDAVVDIQADYLAFGWWRQEGKGGGFSDFQPVHGGRVPFAGSIADSDGAGSASVALSGKATYTGGAAGNYTKDVKGPNEHDRHGGWFLADAKLSASFGDGGTTATADDNRITGTISNFVGAHGSLGEWNVTLGMTTAAAAGAGNLQDTTAATPLIEIDGTDNAVGGTVDGVDVGGAWDGDFYGGTGANRLPSGVAGWFRAATAAGADENIAISGSFAATR